MDGLPAARRATGASGQLTKYCLTDIEICHRDGVYTSSAREEAHWLSGSFGPESRQTMI